MPHRVNNSMHKFEPSSFGYCYSTVEDDSREGACCNVRVYLSKPGILKSKIAEAVVNKNAAASCEERREIALLCDLKTVNVGRSGLEFFNLFYGYKSNVSL